MCLLYGSMMGGGFGIQFGFGRTKTKNQDSVHPEHVLCIHCRNIWGCTHKHNVTMQTKTAQAFLFISLSVEFPNLTHSQSSLLSLCLQNRDCTRLGPPAEGEAVQVRWTDGLIYGAKFVASHSIPMYLVNHTRICTYSACKGFTHFILPHQRVCFFFGWPENENVGFAWACLDVGIS